METEQRLLAEARGANPGLTLIITGALHGNEPAGVQAGRQFVGQLGPLSARLAGRVVAVTGNTGALANARRFVRRDLNRNWDAPTIERLLAAPHESLQHEDAEQRALLDLFLKLESESGGRLAFIDLHTTSGPSAPFVCFGDALKNRRLAFALPITAILGLEEAIDGAMLGYWLDRGYPAIAIETGQHDDPEAKQRHIAALWLCAVALGMLEAGAVPDLAAHRSRLQRAAKHCPRVVEIRHRHVIENGTAFEMLPGFTAFDRIVKGQLVAKDAAGEVVAPESGLMLMPRYQGQGEDGYFLARPVRRFWLRASTWVRRSPAARWLQHLPGVVVDGSPDRLLVDCGKAWGLTTDLMHLCGYRRRADSGALRTFTRRRG